MSEENDKPQVPEEGVPAETEQTTANQPPDEETEQTPESSSSASLHEESQDQIPIVDPNELHTQRSMRAIGISALYFPQEGDPTVCAEDPHPHLAFVVRDNGDGTANLAVFDANGTNYARRSVRVVRDSEPGCCVLR